MPGADATAFGSWMLRNTWSEVDAELFVDTRILQLRKSGRPLLGDGSDGLRQLNRPCGLKPLNGRNPKFRSLAGKLTTPEAFTVAAAGELPRSQFCVGSQLTSVVGTPSHCSMNTGEPTGNPLAVTVKDCGCPDALPGTTNGFPVGVVIVAADADGTFTIATVSPAIRVVTNMSARRVRMAAIEAADRAHLNDQTALFACAWLTVHSRAEPLTARRVTLPVNRA